MNQNTLDSVTLAQEHSEAMLHPRIAFPSISPGKQCASLDYLSQNQQNIQWHLHKSYQAQNQLQKLYTQIQYNISIARFLAQLQSITLGLHVH